MLKKLVAWSTDLISEIEMTTKLISETLDEMTAAKLCLTNKIVYEVVKSFLIRIVKFVDLKNFHSMSFAVTDLSDLTILISDEVSDDKIDDDKFVNSLDKADRSGQMF